MPTMERTNRTVQILILSTFVCVLTAVANPIHHGKHLAEFKGSASKVLDSATVTDMFDLDTKATAEIVSRDLQKREATWTVQAGDSGNGIAIRLSIPFAQLASFNTGVNWRNLQVGQVLRFPCGDSDGNGSPGPIIYTVVAGDTGNAIAATNGITFIALSAANPGVNWRLLQIGQTLRVPAPSMGSTSVSSTTTTSNTVRFATSTTASDVPPDTTSTSTTRTTTSVKSSTVAESSSTGSTSTASRSAATSTPSVVSSSSFSTTSSLFSTISSLKRSTSSAESSSSSRSSTSTETASIGNPSSATSTSLNSMTTSTTAASSTTTAVPRMTTTSNSSSTATSTDAPTSTVVTTSISNIGTQPGPGSQEQDEPSPFLTPPKRTPDVADHESRSIFKVGFGEEEQSTTESPSQYLVKSGDTSYAIAAELGITLESFLDANPGVVWTDLQIGQTLTFPPPVLPAPNPALVRRDWPRQAGLDVYTTFTGPATPSTYPLIASWLSFEQMWTSNLAKIGTNCNFTSGHVPINTAAETTSLRKIILWVAAETSVNPSFILAIILQESSGCVRAPASKSREDIINPGLMQSFKGKSTCNQHGRYLQPCSDSMMRKMLMEGVRGSVNVGIMPGLKLSAAHLGISWPVPVTVGAGVSVSMRTTTRAQAIRDKGAAGLVVQKGYDESVLYYQAARIYNSGRVSDAGDLSGATTSTRCYVSDIVNRLMGWVNAKRQCELK